MVGITFVGVTHACAERMVTLLARVGSRLALSLERASELLAASELKNIVCDRCSFRATLGPRLDVDIRH